MSPIEITPSDDWRTIATALAGRIVDLQDEYNALAKRIAELEKLVYNNVLIPGRGVTP